MATPVNKSDIQFWVTKNRDEFVNKVTDDTDLCREFVEKIINPSIDKLIKKAEKEAVREAKKLLKKARKWQPGKMIRRWFKF